MTYCSIVRLKWSLDLLLRIYILHLSGTALEKFEKIMAKKPIDIYRIGILLEKT